MQVASATTSGVTGKQGQQTTTGYDAFNEMDLDAFVKLLITELQNQDPLNPMDNGEILQQISQIREIESNRRLTETLDSVRLGQDLATASGLIGRSIVALSEAGHVITGRVDQITIEDDGPKVHVGEHVVALKNVSSILAADGDGS